MTTHAEFLPRYLQLRQVSGNLHNHLMEALPTGSHKEGAAALGLLRGGVIVFGSEHEMAILVDYCIYDLRNNGVNTVERYVETSPPPTGSDEWTVLQACRKARYSLFEIESCEKKVGVWLRDLLTNEPLFVMDVGMSQNDMIGLVLAMRVVTVEGISMTTGASLPLGVLQPENRAKFVADFRAMFPRVDLANMSPAEMSAVAKSLIRIALQSGAGERIVTKDAEASLAGRSRARLEPRSQPIRRLAAHPVAARVGRNDPCPCGSGKKFKRCCGGNA